MRTTVEITDEHRAELVAIAGIVRHYGGILLTRNRRHFERVEGLSLADGCE